MSSPLCASTNAEPAYPDTTHKAALFAFDGLSALSMNVSEDTATLVFQAPDCLAAISRTIARNWDGMFVMRRNRQHVFNPPGCKLEVRVGDATLTIGKDHGTLFQDSLDQSEELPYEIRAIDTHFELWTADLPELSQHWGSYGCATPDRLRHILTPSDS